MKINLLAAALTLVLLSGAQADIYIRNKPVPSKPHQTTAYVASEDLHKYFTPEELERVELDLENLRILVDGVAIECQLGPEAGQNVPVVELALALGFQKRVNQQLGITDYVSTDTMEGKTARADAPKRKGAEYNAAAGRMNNVFRETPQSVGHPQMERVQRIGQEIAAVSDMPGLQWNFVIVADPSPNAFCTGVGWVGVTEGLLTLNLSDDELAGVLAHEVGHGCRRDIEEQNYNLGAANNLRTQILTSNAQLEQMVARRAELQAEAAHYSNMASQMQHPSNIQEMRQKADKASRAAEALDRPIRNLEREIKQKAATWSDHKDFATASEFQHQDEIDADQKGLRYATTAGYSADGLMSALQKLAGRNAQTFGKAAYQGGHSHPSLEKRVATMRKVLADWR